MVIARQGTPDISTPAILLVKPVREYFLGLRLIAHYIVGGVERPRATAKIAELRLYADQRGVSCVIG